jgi:predicted MFS family arabinose efflux permease
MAQGGVTFRSVFAVGEFRALWTAQVLSIAGDQLARVALTLLVFIRTDSSGWAALTYALTFIPDLVGGPLLSGLADRFPRRELMVVADVARAVLVGLMAIPGTPFLVLCVLLVVVQLLATPFNAARTAMLAKVLDGDTFVVGQAAINITYQTAQLAGYVIGGAIVAGVGSSVALAVDAVTFAVSAVIVQLGIRHRPASNDGSKPRTTLGSLRSGLRLVWNDRALRSLVALACVSGFYVVAEGLAVPYAAEFGGGPVAAGFLFAASPAGAALGMVLLTRLLAPEVRRRLLGPLAVAACAVLIVCAAPLGVLLSVVVWAVSGVAQAYQTVASAEFIRAVPDSGRGQAFGLAVTSLRVAQGLGVVVAGAVADRLAPSTVVAIAGALGTGVALVAATAWQRARSPESADGPTVSPRPAEAE